MSSHLLSLDEAARSGEEMTTMYIKQKLEHGRVRIWQDVQQKVRTYILAVSLSTFKLEEFIQFLDIVNRWAVFWKNYIAFLITRQVFLVMWLVLDKSSFHTPMEDETRTMTHHTVWWNMQKLYF